MSECMVYAVEYDALDPFKRAAVRTAAETDANAAPLGYRVAPWSRGESCFLLEGPDHYLAHVEEGLGTKNIIADKIGFGYREIGQDAVAVIVNDMVTSGALPLSVAMHLAVGDGAWFKNNARIKDLIAGWKRGCELAGAVWGPGETPMLRDIVYPDGSIISGSALGIIGPKNRVIRPRIQDDDAIVFLLASGIHANGLTLARAIGAKLSHGFAAGEGLKFAADLLVPTPIYVRAVKACLDAGIPIHYAVNITGHGWRKLMRAAEPFVYVVDRMPPLLPVFQFIMDRGPVPKEEMYRTYNMGAGFALYVPCNQAARAVSTVEKAGFPAMIAGRIEKHGDEKRVVIEPENISFEGPTLAIR